MQRQLLLLSNSKIYGESWLEWPLEHIKSFLGTSVTEVLFVPYAAVSFSYDEYERLLQERLQEIGYKVTSVHRASDPVKAVESAQAIAIGGGNTFHLLKTMYETKILSAIRSKVLAGTPYMGWSAGANVASATIRTTNDMPIIEPPSFEALNVVPFQINPHYLDVKLEGHAGETREQRLEEFLVVNPEIYVCGLREGTGLLIQDQKVQLIGALEMRLFKQGMAAKEMGQQESFDFLLNQ